MMKIKLPKIELVNLFIYSILTKFFVSLNSVRFSEIFTDTDQAIFYTVGKAMMHGKVLYKDIFDHKTPYIYFVNAFASIFEKNHLGLFIIEVLLLFFTLVYAHKFLQLFLSKNKSLIVVLFFSILICIPQITFSYSRTEEYAVCFIMISLYLFASNYFLVNIVEDDIKHLPMFLIGICAGLTFMTNIRAAILFVPFAILLLIKLVLVKKYIAIIKLFVYGILGVIVSIIPYLIYMFVTDSAVDAYYAIFITNINYLNSTVDAGKDVISTALTLIKENIFIYILFAFSFISLIILKYDIYFKVSTILSMLIAFIYTTFSNRVYSYYLVILVPYFMSVAILLIKIFEKMFLQNTKKLKNEKAYNSQDISQIFEISFLCIFLIINILINYKSLSNRYINHTHRADRINDAVDKYFDDKSNLKILCLGFMPEAYIYTGNDTNYKYFFIPNISYKIDNTSYLSQYKYLTNDSPDVVIFRDTVQIKEFPQSTQNQIQSILSRSYFLEDTIRTNAYEGNIYIFIKGEYKE